MAARRDPPNLSLIAAAFSSILHRPVITQQEYEEKRHLPEYSKVEELSYDHLSEVVYETATGSVGDVFGESGDKINVSVTLMTGKCCVINLGKDSYVEELQVLLEKKENIYGACGSLSFVYAGRLIERGHRLSEYYVQDNSTIIAIVSLQASAPLPMVLDPNLLDPGYDYDFTNMTDDGTQYMRGNKIYKRPYGWYRYALKVIGKYFDDDWLGPNGMRQESSPNEWPVSYHGTSAKDGKSLAEKGYDLSKSNKSCLYGKGIYSSPSIKVAESYANRFFHENGGFLVVMQNRVSTKGLRVISAEQCGDQDEYWFQEHQENIRPYGICIKEVPEMNSAY